MIQGPNAVTHQQTMVEAMTTKHLPSMALTLAKNYLLAATLKRLNMRDPVDTAVFAATLWVLMEMPVLADQWVESRLRLTSRLTFSCPFLSFSRLPLTFHLFLSCDRKDSCGSSVLWPCPASRRSKVLLAAFLRPGCLLSGLLTELDG